MWTKGFSVQAGVFKMSGVSYGTVELTAPESRSKVPNCVVSIDLYDFYILL